MLEFVYEMLHELSLELIIKACSDPDLKAIKVKVQMLTELVRRLKNEKTI